MCPYVPVVVLQHSMEEEEHVSLCPCSGTTAQYGGGGACVPMSLWCTCSVLFVFRG